MVLHSSRQIRLQNGLMGLKIGPVCPFLGLSGLGGLTSRGPTGPSRAGLQEPAGWALLVSPGMQVLLVDERPFSTKIRA